MVMATKSIPLIALDAGHGLNTAGKRTPNGEREWSLNDAVRDYVVDYLKDYNCEFIFPDGNEGKVDESLASRRNAYVVADADAAVSIHHNALSGKWNNATGVETWVDKKHTSADLRLAECIQKRLPDYTGLKDRGIKEENWAVINQNHVPAVLTEGGFMDSKTDYPVITSTNGQKGYAKAVAEGLIEFLALEKKTNKKSETTNKASSVLYKVQCGAYSKKENADALCAKINKAGFKAYVTKIGGLYKVQCGAYAKKANAEKLRDNIKSAGFDATVVKTSSTATQSTTIKVGSTVKVKKGAKTYEGKALADFVYDRNHKVKSIDGKRVVITYDGVIVAAINKANLILVK